jgi:pimeloyl-ACP methyl ester carboxylesterase
MRNERDMVRALVSRRAFRPGLTFEDAELAAIQQPTLHVYGTADPVGTVGVWRRVVGLLPRGELRLMEGGGHVPWLDDPDQVAGDVRRFLAEWSACPLVNAVPSWERSECLRGQSGLERTLSDWR